MIALSPAGKISFLILQSKDPPYYNFILTFPAQRMNFFNENLEKMINRRPVYFKKPAWPVWNLRLARDRLEKQGLCLSQTGRSDGLFWPLLHTVVQKGSIIFLLQHTYTNINFDLFIRIFCVYSIKLCDYFSEISC